MNPKGHLTAAYTPHHNGLAERFNRTIPEQVRCMLSKANLSKSFWERPLTLRLTNRSPYTDLKMKTPKGFGQGNHLGLITLECLVVPHLLL